MKSLKRIGLCFAAATLALLILCLCLGIFAALVIAGIATLAFVVGYVMVLVAFMFSWSVYKYLTGAIDWNHFCEEWNISMKFRRGSSDPLDTNVDPAPSV